MVRIMVTPDNEIDSLTLFIRFTFPGEGYPQDGMHFRYTEKIADKIFLAKNLQFPTHLSQ